ncbi:orexin receptor type 2-like [Schistocerca americana]|uniref:orexin receptor type 2-like n=1 Tax=Schistocerca americana TaxID=7009 RepID=UPI001F4FDC72|nr:orexin receptor type 2-like [Schistocerca americana]
MNDRRAAVAPPANTLPSSICGCPRRAPWPLCAQLEDPRAHPPPPSCTAVPGCVLRCGSRLVGDQFQNFSSRAERCATVSVAVSVLTLTFISVDRWYAICFPLRFNSTTGRAKTAIAIIWLLALAFDIPELVVLRARGRDWDSVLLTQCEGSWSYDSEMVFHGAKSLLLYTLPLLFMSVAYFQIVRVLWRSDNIPGHDDHNGDVISSKEAGHHATFAPSGSVGSRRVPMAGNSTTEAQLRSRRKAAKMLVAVVAMFAICYLPVHLLNILRYTVDIPQNDTTSAISMLSHWLCYANSAVNPVIYNFMSGKFRAEFRRLFWTCAYGSNRYSPAPGAAPSAAMRSSCCAAPGRLRVTWATPSSATATTTLASVAPTSLVMHR